MTAQLQTLKHGNAIVLQPGGRLNGETAEILREKIFELADAGHRWILLDMCGVTGLPEMAAGDLVDAGIVLARAGGDLKLINVGYGLQKALEEMRLDAVFEVFPDEMSAVRSVERAQAARLRAAADRSELYWG